MTFLETKKFEYPQVALGALQEQSPQRIRRALVELKLGDK
jgi:hypothetical protein